MKKWTALSLTARLSTKIRSYSPFLFSFPQCSSTIRTHPFPLNIRTGLISEDAFQALEPITTLVNSLKIRDATTETGVEFPQYFPTFLWLLRDFSLDFQHLTPK